MASPNHIMDQSTLAALAAQLDPRSLSIRQRQVLNLRLSGLTPVAIGKQLGITAERVRQLEARIASRARRAQLRTEMIAQGKVPTRTSFRK